MRGLRSGRGVVPWTGEQGGCSHTRGWVPSFETQRFRGWVVEEVVGSFFE